MRDVITYGFLVLAGAALFVLPGVAARAVSRRLAPRRGAKPLPRREYARDPAGGVAEVVVTPGEGVGPVRLGTSPCRVEELFGRSLGYDAWDDGNLNDSLIYSGLRLQFDRCDSRGPLARSRLDVVTVRRPDAVLFGRRPLADWDEGGLLAEVAGRGFVPVVIERGYSQFDRPYLALWFDAAGKLNRVEIA